MIRAILILLLFCACASTPETSGDEFAKHEEFGVRFDSAGVRGAFVLFDASAGEYLVYNPERVEQPFLPASTFKILNSLIALETGVIEDEEEVMAWDGVERGWEMWDRDHDLRSAFRYSAVWFYQELARRIGEERMRSFVEEAGYGNRSISGGIDTFWLEGELRITPREQVDFLRRLYANDLPFSGRNMDIVRSIMVLEEGEGYTLRGKTGWAGDMGWFVGYLERGENAYFFAANIDIETDDDAPARIGITRGILADLDLLPRAESE